MNWTGLAGRLEKRYGVGDNLHAARRVYRHVERLCEQHGDRVYVIVQDLAAYADRARSPGKVFRAYVLERIEAGGFPVKGGQAGANAPDLVEKMNEVRARIGAEPIGGSPSLSDPSRPAVSDVSEMVRELERLRRSNDLLREELARERYQRKGVAS
jgi:hypothetical protein